MKLHVSSHLTGEQSQARVPSSGMFWTCSLVVLFAAAAIAVQLDLQLLHLWPLVPSFPPSGEVLRHRVGEGFIVTKTVSPPRTPRFSASPSLPSSSRLSVLSLSLILLSKVLPFPVRPCLVPPPPSLSLYFHSDLSLAFLLC